ncbi:MAG: helix-turn-helix domain-containing protein [Firmicutes bacterium]|jgi:excisionase family DNA binding protein|nr:helix-turn-helix domain-containing protein [Bacillota bacterium]
MIKKMDAQNKLALSIPQAADALGLSETFTRQLVYSGELPAVKVGRRWIVPVNALDRWLAERTGER